MCWCVCRSSNIFDNMLAMMQKYAGTLESLVDDRTAQLAQEKRTTEALLHRMLPRCVSIICHTDDRFLTSRAWPTHRRREAWEITPLHSGDRNGKVIGYPYPGSHHHQTLITSRRSPVAHAYHVWSTSVSAFASYPGVRGIRTTQPLSLRC